MEMKKAIVHFTKTGNRYYAEEVSISEGFVKLTNPIRRNKVERDIVQFEKVGKTFRSRPYYLHDDYGVKLNDLMFPSYTVTIVSVGDVTPPWVNQTKQEVTATLDRLQEEAKITHDKAKQEFLSKMGLFKKILYYMGE